MKITLLKLRPGISFAFVWLLLLAGCQRAANSATLTPTAAPTLAPVIASPTPAPLPTGAARPGSTASTTPAAAIPATAGATPTPTICAEARGRVESQQIDSQAYGNGAAFVYLPPCYAANPKARYPVLYLLHGSNTDNTQWIDLGVPQTADRLIQSGQTPAFIVVMPREANYLQDPDQSPYGNWVIHALVPWIDQHYATCAERACRAIGGLSRGGSWAFRVGLDDWQDFSAVGMNSAVPFYGDQAKSQAIFPQIPPAERPRFFVDIGSEDGMVSGAKELVAGLDRLGITPEWHLWPGAHNRAYWRLHVEDYLRWYALGWIH